MSLRNPSVRLVLLVTAACVLASVRQASALDPGKTLRQYGLTSWRTAHGLPNSHVQAILQTRDGYLWLGTEEGVVRFDGVEFRVFDRANTPQLQSNSIWGLAEMEDGTLWVGTLGGLNGYKEGKWTAALTAADGLPNVRINRLVPGRRGALWIATQGGLARLRNGRIDIVRAKDDPLRDEVTAVLEDPDGTVWMGTMTKGVVRLQGDRIVRYAAEDGLGSNLVRSLTRDARGVLWIGTAAGLTRFRDGQFTTYAGAREGDQFAAEAILADRAGNLWVATRARGLARFHDGGLEFLAGKDSLDRDTEVLHEDRNGSLWVGSSAGLTCLTEGRFTVHDSWNGRPLEEAGTVLQDRQGTLWVGTDGGLLGRTRDGRVFSYTQAEGLVGDTVRTLAEGQDGSLWIGGQSSGLFNLRDGRLTRYTTAQGLRGQAVRAIHASPDGTVWVGTRDGGLNRFRDGRFTTYGTQEGLAHEGVTAIRQTADGSLWIGAISGGLTRLRDGRFQVYTARDGLPAEDVLSLQVDSEGSLWIGTSKGLGRWREGGFTAYTKRLGLCDDLVLSVLEDAQGSLWLASNKGFCQVPRVQIEALDAKRVDRLTPRLYTTADGLRSESGIGVHQDTGTRDPEGRLWFASPGGLAMIDPGRVYPKAAALEVDIEEVYVDERLTGATVHAPGDGELELHYTAPTLLRPERTTFRYMLEGFDKDWTNAGTRRTAYYTNIPPGSYRFRVAALNEDGVWSEPGASRALQLRPHFYQTTWFHLLWVSAAVLGTFGLHRIRVRHLKDREEELRRHVEEGLAQIKVLSGLLPICAVCKKIRDGQGCWDNVESYIEAHSQAAFSHGLCPDCMARDYPEYARKVRVSG